MRFTNTKRLAKYAFKHKHMVYSYVLLRLAMVSPFEGVNAFLHRLRGVHTGKRVKIAENVLLDPVEPGRITLEDDVTIGPGVTIFAHENPTLPLYEYMGPRTVKPVRIKEGSRIGAGAIILPGVTIGSRCVINAGAVVTRDIPDFTLAGGVPAQPIESLNNYSYLVHEKSI